MRRVFYLFAGLLLLPLIDPVAAANALGSSSTIEPCFNYYQYAKVRVDVTAEKDTYTSGSEVALSGTIVNGNTFPLADVTLYAQVKRGNHGDSFLRNGHFLIDRLPLLTHLNFLSGETKGIKTSLTLPPEYPNGSYILQYFIFSNNQFYYGGRSFLEEDNAGSTQFSITGGQEPTVYFDVDSITVNSTPQDVRGFVNVFRQFPLTLSVAVKDTRSVKNPLHITAKTYRFDDGFESNLIENDALTPSQDGIVQKEFLPPNPGAYVVVFEVSQPVKSVLKYRFAADGTVSDELRMADLNITNYPPSAEDKAYVCFHASGAWKTPETKVTLQVLDEGKKIVSEGMVSDSFPSEVQAMTVPLASLSTRQNFYIRANFASSDGKKDKTAEIHFECLKYHDSLQALHVSYDSKNSQSLMLQGIDGCGEKTSSGYIESIRISDGSKVEKEYYNITSIPSSISLSDLPPGSYSADIQAGKMSKTIVLDIQKKSAKNYLLWIFVIGLIFTGFVVSVVYVVKKRKQRSI